MFKFKFYRQKKEFIFLLALAFLFFYKLILHPHNMIYPAYDIGTYSLTKSFFAESFKRFHYIPLWNPYSFGGAPFAANTESAIFYPSNLFFLAFPINLAFGYVFISDLFLLGFFTYLFSREMKLDKFSSLVSSITIMFSGTITSRILPGHIFILDSIIWFPLLLLCYQKGIESGKIIYGFLAGITIALILLAGNPQLALYEILSGALFSIAILLIDQRNFAIIAKKMLQIFFASIVIGVSLSAIQLIPSIEFSRLSVRSLGLSYLFASDFSLHPYQLITFLLPHFFGSPLVKNTYWGINGNFWELCAYAGIFPLLLSVIAFLHKRHKYAFLFVFLGLFSLFFSFGRFGFIFPFFYSLVPGFDLFRAPARFLFVYEFSIAILAGMGASSLMDKNLNLKILKRSIGFLILLAVTCGVILLYGSLSWQEFIRLLRFKGYALGNDLEGLRTLISRDLILFTALLFLSGAILFCRLKNLLKPRSLHIFILVAIIFDLWFFSLKFYEAKTPKEIFASSSEIRMITKDKSRFRVFDLSGKMLVPTGQNHIESLTGFDAKYLNYYRDFLWLSGDHANTPYESFFSFDNIKNLNILKLLNTKYVIGTPNRFLFESSQVNLIQPNLYEIKNTMPRAYIVPNAIVIKEKSSILKKLNDPSFDPKANIILEKITGFPLANSSLFKPVALIKFDPNRIELKTVLKNPGYLVLSEVWYPGWKAYDNGKEKEIYRADYLFRSIYLDKGKHEITFIYDPKSYRAGKFITILSLVLIFCISIYKRYLSL